MRRRSPCLVSLLLLVSPVVFADWVDFADETASRLIADPSAGIDDGEEKDFAWGDVDRDGDIDLVSVRKEIGTSPGKRTNVLYLNEGGVLVDRTLEYATASDVAGDLGFHTPTNDRDVELVDVDGDGWLDIVTATTISADDPKHLGHPRIYRNLGLDAGTGAWLGFRYEDARIPTMPSYTGVLGWNPRFCGMASGDVTGDGKPDLYFNDYDTGEFGPPQPAGADYNDRLLINDGNGFFVDETQDRFLGLIGSFIQERFEVSSFGTAAEIADMNGDGKNDIIKVSTLVFPLFVGIAYNDPENEGFFDSYRALTNNAPYFVEVGDLNNDGRMDMIIGDDADDRYYLNDGNGDFPNFVPFLFSHTGGIGDGIFSGDTVIADLNNDGWQDVVIAGGDVDSPNCSLRTAIYRNLGGEPGDDVVIEQQASGTGCSPFTAPPTCIVAGIPTDQLVGVFDMAVFDLDDDGWQDLILGKCDGIQIFMNQPLAGLNYDLPAGLPDLVPPGASSDIEVEITGFGGAKVEAGTTRLFTSINGGQFAESSMTQIGAALYEASLPPAACGSTLRYYFSAEADTGGTFTDPVGAPLEFHQVYVAPDKVLTLQDGIEGSVGAWTVVNDPMLTGGGWEAATPVGTITGGGQQAAPDDDAEPGPETITAFVTENGVPGQSAAIADVDGGPTDLLSPTLDLSTADAVISYRRWFFTESGTPDDLTVWVSSDGNRWHLVETVTGQQNSWQVSSFKVGDYVTPTATVRVRFRVSDPGVDSITEAAIDDFRVEQLPCTSCVSSPECDDGQHCNGVETCQDNFCSPGVDPCPGENCDDTLDTCVACAEDAHCSDGIFCNGQETCVANVCGPPLVEACPGQLCNESLGACVDCLDDAECDDGLFCNGAEFCAGGTCGSSAAPCLGQPCDELTDRCVGAGVQLQPRLGEPLLGLTEDELDRFEAGRAAFDNVLTEANGLGPIFNQHSCGSCHNTPLGGSGTVTVTRFGFNDDKSGGFDPLEDLGGSLHQQEAISPECGEIIPPEANVIASRATGSTLGFGLIESVADTSIRIRELLPPAPGISGRAHMVETLEDPGPARVGRFGWKAQVATVLSFSADASLNEMGLTNRLLTAENAPNGDQGLLAQCDTVADPEDGPDAEGFDFIDRVTDFQRFLAPPPQTPRTGMSGEAVFNSIGCAHCHTPAFTTIDWDQLPDVLRNKSFRPYSDFLLHDMGLAGDFIVQGDAQAREIRTAPLWGVRVRDPLWHDGRVAGGTFAERIADPLDGAIAQHRAVFSEGEASAEAFFGLPQADQDALVAFLDSLGRADFDHDGDNDVDGQDWLDFVDCRTAPPPAYTPDDSCSIFDIDQDGDLDGEDYAFFLIASDGLSGAVPDGARVGGTPLTLTRGPGNDLSLNWSASCVTEDTDYAIYEGVLGNFTSHEPVVCSTAGATNLDISASAGDRYYLVVPTNGFSEGSYGTDSRGLPRPPSLNACQSPSPGGCQ